jgi:transcription elongation factor Elf1
MTMTQKEDDTPVPKTTDTAPVKSYLKTQYVRSKRLLEVVASLNCQHCGHYLSQATHSNWHGEKGRGIKASDNYVAALCQSCHTEVDSGNKLSKDERKTLWVNAHLKTLHYLLLTDQWPHGVPVTDLYLKKHIPLA